MKRKILLILAGLAFSNLALAHLCHDYMFVKDKLVVKANIRNGQLRLHKEATFKVYVVNTMDVDFYNIKLEVRSREFHAQVRPSPTWRTAPYLRALRRGGKREYFTVKLKRKPGVRDGKYKVSLVLYHGKKRSQVFRTIDLAQAADTCELPKAPAVKVDGQASQEEWGRAPVCTGLRTWVVTNRPWKGSRDTRPAPNQCRFRVSCDEDYLYCLVQFQSVAGATADRACLYLAKSMNTKGGELVSVSFDRLAGRVSCSAGKGDIEAKTSADKSVRECRIPRSRLGIKDVKAFCANFTRTTQVGKKRVVSYWRGNSYSLRRPVVYGRFTIPD
jgi:hypothetical protein